MLSQISIEVHGESSPASTCEALDRYENKIGCLELLRRGEHLIYPEPRDWTHDFELAQANHYLGRELLSEHVEYTGSGYKGGRVVCFAYEENTGD
jgi:hypothetical protein